MHISGKHVGADELLEIKIGHQVDFDLARRTLGQCDLLQFRSLRFFWQINGARSKRLKPKTI